MYCLYHLNFAICLADEVLWYELCENTPSSPEQSAQHFGELANALQILHHYKQEWSEDDVVSIMDEITGKYLELRWKDHLISYSRGGHLI